jgi:hypothetical protein
LTRYEIAVGAEMRPFLWANHRGVHVGQPEQGFVISLYSRQHTMQRSLFPKKCSLRR